MRWFRQEVVRKDGSRGPRLSEGTANFVAGGMGSSKAQKLSQSTMRLGVQRTESHLRHADLFWICAYPFDNVKKWVKTSPFPSDNVLIDMLHIVE